MLRDDKKTPIRRQTMDQSGGIGVITWVASPIKFQADTGLLPALAHFLLKHPALQRSADAKAFVQLTRETV